MTDEQYMNLERDAIDCVKNFARQHSPLLRMIWGQGDGDGGAVLDIIRSYAGIQAMPIHRPIYSKKTIPQALRTQVFERDKYRCCHCGTHLNLSCDHIHPESKGGRAELSNLQTLCRSCNSAKGCA